MLAGCVEWPQELAERYRRKGYWRGECLGSLPAHVLCGDPKGIAVVAANTRLSYGELDQRADRLAAGFR